jgi:chromosomal replication initiator protein
LLKAFEKSILLVQYCTMVENIWNQFLTLIRQEAGSRVVETWFKAVVLSRWDLITGTAYLQAPNKFVKDWIKHHYIDLIRLHLARLLNVDKVMIVFIDASTSNSTHESGASIGDDHQKIVIVPAKRIQVKKSLSESNGCINNSYLFNTFVVGPSNSLAYAAAQAVAQKPGTMYNPFFLYGYSGLGKTHLLHAIGNEIKALYPDMSILYQPADRFVNEFINAIRFDELRKFQAKYKAVDVLLVDDIQFISNKEQTQEAFFHIFNTLYYGYKQIVFSGDAFPQDLSGIAERLKSRMAWGLVADVSVPTIETKIAIIQKKADFSNIAISDEVAHFVAMSAESNIRELEGALTRVIAFASLTNQQITLELAKKVLVRQESVEKNSVTIEAVIKCMGKHYSYTLTELKSKNRSKQISFARQVMMFFLREKVKFSLRDIGIFMGGRDHSTVIHAINRIEQHANLNNKFQAHLKQMEQEIIKLSTQ